MLHVTNLSVRIAGRLLIDAATVAIQDGLHVGLVGRNGAGKTTLLRVIGRDLAPESGGVAVPRGTRIGQVAQEAPEGPESLIDFVLSADRERAALLAEAEAVADAARHTDAARLGEIHARLNDIDAHAAPARAASILSGLGFDEAAQQRPLSLFSGGWRMRVALAAVLFAEPDLLLLDEPTNYLDLEGALWLEGYLASYPGTTLVVSHDRDILNRAVSAILHLDRGKLTLYRGGYDSFERQRREALTLQARHRKKQEEERKRIQAFVDRFRAKATKARQAQSRLKMLERMEPVAAVIESDVRPFAFPAPAKPLSPPILRLDGVTVGYAEPVLKRLTLRIDDDDRIGLLGANGNGKSTFAKLLSGRLSPMSGDIWRARGLEVAYFAQHQLDELEPTSSPYAHVRTLMPEAGEAQVRSRTAQLGFGPDKADTPVRNLSGGEKARLLLGLATFRGPHLLILDEPTNHLDIDSREALVEALNDYPGAVILISHDRHLIEACADRLWLVANGTVKPFDGDLDDYRRTLLAEGGARRAPEPEKAGLRTSAAFICAGAGHGGQVGRRFGSDT